MLKTILAVSLCLCVISSVVWADTFGTGGNQFTIDFVTISGATNPTSGIPAGTGFTFTGVANDYRIGKYEITNDQWTKFKAAYGAVLGSPSGTGSYTDAYDQEPYFPGTSVPTEYVSWYEAAQFVNYLNISTGHQAAYKFTGTQGTAGYTLGVWSASDAGYNASNPYRNSNAFYFLPTENEWIKAAYWNGSALQTYATKAGESLYQGNGSNGGWNYYNTIWQPWNVGSGSEELNGTFDMMGNVWEWMESPGPYYLYKSGSPRGIRGGSYYRGALDAYAGDSLSSSYNIHLSLYPYEESGALGFRVASVPEPCSLALLGLGGLVLRYRKR